MLKAARILSSVSESALVYAVRNMLTMPAGESSCWLADFIAQTTHQVYVDGNGFFGWVKTEEEAWLQYALIFQLRK